MGAQHGQAVALMAFNERPGNGGEMNFPGRVVVTPAPDLVTIETDVVDIHVYYHRNSEGVEYLVIDMDTDADEPYPMRIYRNDGLVHEEGL